MNLLFTTGNYAALHAQRNAQLDQQAAQMPNTTQQDKVAQWHMSRRHGLSGSQIAAVMGFSKWLTPFNVWLFITGRQSEGSANTAPLEWVYRLEPVIAQKYQDDRRDLVRVSDPTVPAVPFFSWICRSPRALDASASLSRC